MDQQPFADLLKQHVQQDGRHVRQLSQATATLFGTVNQVPNNTISRWLRGGAKKPRNWSDIVKLGAVLQLSQADLQQLLQAAGHNLPDLLETAPPIPGLFDWWQAPVPERLPPFQAPPGLSGFIGRDKVLGSVSRYLRSQGQSRVCCLLGMAGLGKTSLAAQLAYHLREAFVDGVLWVSLDQSEPLSAMLGLAQAYGVDLSIYPDLGTRSSKLRELLASKNALLVLDQATQDDQLRPLLPGNGRCAVLITSRRHDLAITAAAFRVTLSPFDPEKGESVALFQQVMGKQAVTEAAQLQQIADFLGHLPLAVHVAAQRLHHEPGWTVAHLLDRWRQAEQPLSLLAWGDQQVRPRFAASTHALDLADQQLFALLGSFPGTFSALSVAEIAERPLWQVEDGLRRLYLHSLLLSPGKNRYQLPPLLRAFSQEQPQQAAWPPRFVAHFTSPPQIEAAAAEQHNIIAAIYLADKCQLDEVVVTAVAQLYPHLQGSGQLIQAKALLTLAEQTARRRHNSAGLIRILQQTGFTAMKQGLPHEADGYYQEALTLAKQTNDAGQTAEILHKLSALAYRRGRLEEAQQFCLEALTLARQVENQHLIASLLTNLGLAEVANGRFAEATTHYEEALTTARHIKDRGLIINILQNLGHVHEQRGDYAQAKTFYEEGLTLAEAQKDPELRSRMLGNLGAVACHLGNYAEATAHFRTGLSLAEANGLSIQQYRQQANLGQAATYRGQFHQANTHYREALRLVRQLDFPEDLGIILNQAGDSYLAQEAYQEAGDLFSEALTIAEEKQLQRVGPLSLFGLARVAVARGNVVEARRLAEQSRQQLLALGHCKADEVWWWLQELPRTAAPE